MHIEKNADKLVKTLRVLIQDQPGYLGRLCTAIGEAGGNIGEVKTVGLGLVRNTRDMMIYVDDDLHLQRVVEAIHPLQGIEPVEVIDEVLKRHEGGKIAVISRYPLESIADMGVSGHLPRGAGCARPTDHRRDEGGGGGHRGPGAGGGTGPRDSGSIGPSGRGTGGRPGLGRLPRMMATGDPCGRPGSCA